MKTEPTQNAFPIVYDGITQDGLTKREYFAAMAMQGICTAFSGNEKAEKQVAQKGLSISRAMAIYAIDVADELIKALNETQP